MNGPLSEQQLGEPAPRGPQPPWSVWIAQPPAIVDRAIQEFFGNLTICAVKRANYPDGTIRYTLASALLKRTIACTLYLRPLGEDVTLAVDDPPALPMIYSFVSTGLLRYLARHLNLPPIVVESPLLPEEPDLEEILYEFQKSRDHYLVRLVEATQNRIASEQSQGDSQEVSERPTLRSSKPVLSTAEEIAAYEERLALYRRRLAHDLASQARLGGATPFDLAENIREARSQIGLVKVILRTSGVTITDHPDD